MNTTLKELLSRLSDSLYTIELYHENNEKGFDIDEEYEKAANLRAEILLTNTTK